MMGQTQMEYVEYFKYLCSVITNDARCTREIKSRIAMATATFIETKKSFHQHIEVKVRKKLETLYI
jgi:hypothetical protein